MSLYMSQVAGNAGSSDAIDAVLAGRIGNSCKRLVNWASATANNNQRKAVYAACQYFILEEDAAADTGPGGFMDDADVVNAVAFYCGRGDIRVNF